MAGNGRQGRNISPSTLTAIQDHDSVWSQVDAIRTAQKMTAATVRPPNSFTAPEYMAQYGIPPSTAARQIKKMLDAGKIVGSLAYVVQSGGSQVIAKVYTPK